ncbi:MAG: C45 family autoproteolytic acyltransferase/hydrolase [Paracoccaceae bacterium]
MSTIETLDETATGGPDGRRSRLRWYRESGSGKRFYRLAQAGAFPDLCRDHGELLAGPIVDGVFPEIMATIAGDLDTPSDLADAVTNALYRRLSDDVLASTSDEFCRGAEALHEGVASVLGPRAPTLRQVTDACTSIDVGNLATGFTRRLAKPLAAENVPVYEYLIGAVLRHGLDRDAAGTTAGSLEARVERRRLGMGCTGFALAPDLTADGRALHARTFDGAFFAWNRWPGLHLVDERDADPRARHRYAAVGTAGLVYPGGISGMNDAGIACSLHQMSTVNYTPGDGSGVYEIAPFVMQRILREAGSLDEAVALAEATRTFAAWTIVVSDARTGRSLRIELAGREDERGRYAGRVEASAPAARTLQTNHFLSAALAERFDFFEDAHFTKTLGKWLETRARMRTLETRLDLFAEAAGTGTDEAIELLANHDDADAGGRRAFGRTICKAYGLMASVARADPDRDRADDAFWFTIGDVLPGPHAAAVGLALDWDALDARPVAERPVRRAASASAAHLAAMRAYVDAFATLTRPRDEAGGYVFGDPSAERFDALRREALDRLDAAVARVEGEGPVDPTLRYARARLAHAAGRFAEAARDWSVLRGLADEGGLHVWEVALVHLLAAATEAALGRDPDALDDAGEAALDRAERVLFADTKRHPDLDAWRERAKAIREDGAAAALPAFDFVTVE